MHFDYVRESNKYFTHQPSKGRWISQDRKAMVLNVSDSSPEPSKRFYVLNSSKIGSGSFSTVYLATQMFINPTTKDFELDSKKQDKFAVKVFKKRDRLSDSKKTKILNEAKCLEAAYKNPVYTITTQKQAYIIMEYVNASTMGERTKLNPKISSISFEGRVEIAFFLSLALLNLHTAKQPILHLDIKLENILIDAERKLVRFLDFGAAEFMNSITDQLIDIEYVRGSTLYSAPEIFLNYKVGTKSDIFSMALVLLVLFNCKDPKKNRNEKWYEIQKKLEQDGLLEKELKADPAKQTRVKAAVNEPFLYDGFGDGLTAPELGFNVKAAVLGFIMQMGSLDYNKRPNTQIFCEFMRILNNACKRRQYNASKSNKKLHRTLFTEQERAILTAYEAEGQKQLDKPQPLNMGR